MKSPFLIAVAESMRITFYAEKSIKKLYWTHINFTYVLQVGAHSVRSPFSDLAL